MAAASSFTIAAPLASNPTAKLTSLSSSTPVFFSNNLNNRAGLGLALDRPSRPQKRGFSCNCIFGLGVPEIVVIVGVSALVFGPKALPEVGRGIGKTVKGFQQAAKEFETELRKDLEASEEASDEKLETVKEGQKIEA
ncbi:sec-independent protein translocase protein TATA, chloroplastic-like [Salvia splendens]|uniref:sec-independent protein translocase protein TATA, chloroplastic-like n=1 Tax=Salvia splendens TaxID=180675 RepID=UPI001C278AD7|nr:sec-independent protein translocase protein TATA, chloroplastic-like [Salvia splendens]